MHSSVEDTLFHAYKDKHIFYNKLIFFKKKRI